MKNLNKKKLALDVHTIRSLQMTDLEAVQGGKKFGSDKATHCGGSDCLIPVEL